MLVEQTPHWLSQMEVLAIPLGVLYVLLNRRARHRLRNVRLTNALLVELQYMHGSLKDIINDTHKMEKTPQAPSPHSVNQSSYGYRFWSAVYDGLVSSSNIAYFDNVIQMKIHVVYHAVRWLSQNTSQVTYAGDTRLVVREKEVAIRGLRNMSDAVQEVTAFRDRNQYTGRWLSILKAIGLAYDV